MSKSREVAKGDALERVNFLYQAAHLALCQGNTALSRFYCLTLGSIVKKSVLRLDVKIKRSLCKKCCSLLVPGITSRVRLRKRRNRSHQVITCLQCHQINRYPVDQRYQLWSENPAAWVGPMPEGITSHPPCGAATSSLPLGRSSRPVAKSTQPAPQSSHAVATSGPEAQSSHVVATSGPEAQSSHAVATSGPEAQSSHAVATSGPEAQSSHAVATSGPEAQFSHAVATSGPEAQSSHAVATPSQSVAQPSLPLAESLHHVTQSSLTIAQSSNPEAQSLHVIHTSSQPVTQSSFSLSESLKNVAQSSLTIAQSSLTIAQSSEPMAQAPHVTDTSSQPLTQSAHVNAT